MRTVRSSFVFNSRKWHCVIVLIPALFLTSSVVVASDHIALCAHSLFILRTA